MALATRNKIGIANQKDRAKIDKAVKDYILTLKDEDYPQLTECAQHAGISERTLIRYELSTPEDSEIRLLLDFIRDEQKTRLIKNGLKGNYNSKLVMFLLERTQGMKQDPQSLSQTNIFNGVSPELLAEALALTRSKPIKGK